MITNWESKKERLSRFMKIPAKKKLEWLQAMHEFSLRFYSQETKRNFWKLRQRRWEKLQS